MLVGIQKWLKVSALGLAVLGACSATAMAESTFDSTSAQSQAVTTQDQTKRARGASDYTQAPYYQALRGQTLRVGITMTPPFAFVTNSLSTLHGIDIDIITELQKRTGFSFEGGRAYVMNFDALMQKGGSGQLDILAGGITLSQSRAQTYDFSEPYMSTSLVLVTRDNSPIKDVKDLEGRSLAAEGGTTASDLFPEAKDMNIRVEKSSSAFMSLYDVYSQQADAVVIDRPMVDFYMSNWKDSNLNIVEQVSDESYLGLLFKKNPNISRPLQEAYRDMVQDGTVQRIVDQYAPRATAQAH